MSCFSPPLSTFLLRLLYLLSLGQIVLTDTRGDISKSNLKPFFYITPFIGGPPAPPRGIDTFTCPQFLSWYSLPVLLLLPGHKHTQAAHTSPHTHHKHRGRRRTGCQAGVQTDRHSVGRRETRTTMGCCNRRCGLIAGAVFGALVAILGGILIPVGNSIVEETVKKEAVIEDGTTAYDNWVSVGAPMYRQFYFFDVQNPDEVINGSIPEVKEKGPYTYRVRYLPKDNIELHPNHTISYQLPLGAIFEPSMSVGPEDDIVTTLNLLLVGALPMLEGMAWLPNLRNAPLFQNRTVKNLLWGYKNGSNVEIGLFSPYNGTYDGNYTIFTGKDDISKVGTINKYKGEGSLGFWNDTYCNMINGTDASSFAPFVDKTKPLYFFSSDICRSVSADYTETLDLLGIEVYRFSLMPKILAAPVDNPDNYCFCPDEKVFRNFTMSGVMDISSCEGKPVYISLPHFLHGSAFLREDVLGLNPSKANHSTFLDVEPVTGFTLRFAKRLQLNMMYRSSKKIKELNKVRDYTIFPIVWVNEVASMDDETAEMFKKELFSRIDILDIAQKVLLGVGVSVFVLCLIGYCVVRRRDSQSKIA